MTTYDVWAYVSLDFRNTSLGYQPKAPIATVGRYRVEADDPNAAAEKMFAVGNRMEQDAEGRSWPSTVRSLSVGDLLAIEDGTQRRKVTTFLAVERFGWKDVVEPTNPIQPLAGSEASSL